MPEHQQAVAKGKGISFYNNVTQHEPFVGSASASRGGRMSPKFSRTANINLFARFSGFEGKFGILFLQTWPVFSQGHHIFLQWHVDFHATLFHALDPRVVLWLPCCPNAPRAVRCFAAISQCLQKFTRILFECVQRTQLLNVDGQEKMPW